MEQIEKTFETRELTISMGPQHPATHGVLRLVLTLDGETVIKCTPHVGYLHRGVEKLGENRTYFSALPLTDRLDYISSMNNNVGYVNAVEKLFGIEAPERAKFIRTMVAEMGRISSHIIWLGTHVLDIGATTPFLYAFRERERILDLFEALCGARLTVSYPRIGGVRNDVSQEFLDELYKFVLEFPSRMDDYETLVTENRVWRKRTVGIGVISAEEAVNWGLTGGMLRGSGVCYDVRKHAPYDAYDKVEFDVPLGKNGDCYDRYIVRMGEMRQANRIIKQCIEKLPTGPVMADAPKFTLPPKDKILKDMEHLIHQFVLITKGPIVPEGEIYSATEVPKGELGFYFVSDGTGKPYRMRVRAPSFVHVSILPKLCEGGFVADVIANIGSIDIVLGECDR
ncbi:MAG: NADH dehydrogenase [Nitrospirae bacterium GWF2_44_13]|nr:MAG: NADH dehydrogenase [Nitrospirae bacterium GWF2_44_13]OGW66392.1 MAG: NADH dehydrogenase [Nitrospirae bacterium RIFOXYA2_FULL_44_9]OGW73555.1 MAG: NADH dehydrogenase [Nitrospirae bacterium RIFOXYC2_FULL_44_7]HBG92674.1 NADH-quinone oxidoreductase subunit D [Nitrospiraceae bacterium]